VFMFGSRVGASEIDERTLARLSQLAVAFLQIGLFCACKCLIRKGAARANACSEDFGRCGQAA